MNPSVAASHTAAAMLVPAGGAKKSAERLWNDSDVTKKPVFVASGTRRGRRLLYFRFL